MNIINILSDNSIQNISLSVEKLENRRTHLYVKVSGIFSIDEANRITLTWLYAAKKHRISKILIDGSDISGSISFMDRYNFNEFLAREHIKYLGAGKYKPIKLAIILKKSLLDPQRFGVTVSKNRGVDQFSTDSITEAYQWLGVPLSEDKES